MKKTKAPLILFGFLGILVCCIIASIVIALKNPVMEDQTYFVSKKEFDYEVNTLLKEQKWFLKNHKLFLEISSSKKQRLELIPPYFQTKVHETFTIDHVQKYDLNLIIDGEIPKDFQAHLYLERINSNEDKQDMGIFSNSIGLEIAQKGRYKAIVLVTYMRENEAKKLFFEREIFVL